MNINNVLRNYDKWVKSNYNIDNMSIFEEYVYYYSVFDTTTFLVKHMDLCEEDMFIAQTIAIVHHCAVFRKIKFSLANGNHAKEGSLLLQQNLLKLLLPETRRLDYIISQSVFNHHRTTFENDTSPRVVLHSKLLQLAIKLTMLNKYIHNLENTVQANGNIPLSLTIEVKQALKTSTPISFSLVQNDLDMLAFQLGIVNSSTPQAALKLIQHNGYIERLIDAFLKRYPLCNKVDIELIKHTANTTLLSLV